MRNHLRSGALCAVLVAVAASATAQFDSNGPNAVFTLNGSTASVVDPVGHKVQVSAPGTLAIEVGTGVNPSAPLITLYGPTNANSFATPWGGNLDLGISNPVPPFIPTSIQVMGDGVFFTAGILDAFWHADGTAAPSFRFAVAVPGSFAGANGSALQHVVLDPTAPPFNFDNTEAAEPDYFNGQVLSVATGDDGTVNVPLSVGKTFNYYGTSYSDIWINGNAIITFTGPIAFPGVFYAGNTISQLNDVPHISANWSDWNVTQQAPGDAVLFVENGLNATVTWGGSQGSFGTTQPGISHFGDTDVAIISASIDLDDGFGGNPNEGRVQCSYSLDPAAANNNDAVIGLVAGGGSGTLNFNQDFHQGVLGGAGDSLLEEHDSTASLPANGRIGYNGSGARQAYHNGFRKFNGQTLTFVPNPSIITTGDQGYYGSMSAPRPNDAIAGLVPSAADYLGGTIVTITGWFAGFMATGGSPAAVVFDPSGAAINATVFGVFDNSFTHPLSQANPSNPEWRDNEGLLVVVPANPPFTGFVDVAVTFDDGSTIVIPSAFQYTSPGSFLTTYSALPDDGPAQTHVLNPAVTIVFGGTTYTQMLINPNGFVTFATGSFDFSQTIPEMQNGFRSAAATTPNPGVAIAWHDLNPPGSGGNVTVLEDTAGGTVEVSYNNQTHWNGGGAAGSFSCTFNQPSPGSVTFNHSAYVNSANILQGPIIGITCGLNNPTPPGLTHTDVNLVGGVGQGISSGVPYNGSIFQAFGDGNGAAVPNGEPVDLQTVNGNGVWTALETGVFNWLLF